MVITWRLDVQSVPEQYPAQLVRSRMEDCLRRLSRSTHWRLRFAYGPSSPLAQRDVVFRFAELPEQRAAYTQKVADWAALVSFSTLKRWDITTFQRWLNSDTNLETFVLHEMGHVVGLRHTQNTRSIMAAHPPLTKELHSSDAAVWRSYIRKLDGQARTTQGLIA